MDAILAYADKLSMMPPPLRGGQSISGADLEDLQNIPLRFAKLMGWLTADNERIAGGIFEGKRSDYSLERWQGLLEAPFKISHLCCNEMKKKPMKRYQKETGRHPMTAMMAAESRLRMQAWMKHGCNAFDSSEPKSMPMAFWLENDILQYIKENDLLICKLYGDVVPDYEAIGQCDGQCTMFDVDIPLKTTGAKRTGCMLCLFGAQREKGYYRLQALHKLHPNIYEWAMKPLEEGGLGYKEVIDWLNENVDTNIRY